MANHTTGAQRYNNRMDKIWENARKNGAFDEWFCKKGVNVEWECESKRGTGIYLSDDGAVRFTKFDCDTAVKVDGKIQKNKCGVELR